MFAVRRYKKALYALPLISFAVASLIHIGASFADKHRSPYSQPVQAAGYGFAPAPSAAVESKAPSYERFGVLRARFRKFDTNCAKPVTFHFSASVFDAKSVSTMSGFLRDEILLGARNTPGMGIHAYFVSPTGEIPPALAGFQKLADSIPGGIGIINQTPSGMTFTPGWEASAKRWLAVVSSEISKPDPAGMFGIVIEPPSGGCESIK
jgi:hypothetical protein